MHTIIPFVLAHPVVDLVAFWLFSALISFLPQPTPTSSVAYASLFHALNVISGFILPPIQAFFRARLPYAPLPSPSVVNVGAVNVLQMPSPAPETPPKSA